MATNFDIDAYGRALAEWDVSALLDMYAQDAEFVQINRENPPDAPRVHRGRETLGRLFSHCASIGVKPTHWRCSLISAASAPRARGVSAYQYESIRSARTERPCTSDESYSGAIGEAQMSAHHSVVS